MTGLLISIFIGVVLLAWWLWRRLAYWICKLFDDSGTLTWEKWKQYEKEAKKKH